MRNGKPLGETQFRNMHAAYDDLPDALKQRLEGRTGLHQQLLERLHIVGQVRAIDGSVQQLHGHACSQPTSTTGNR